MKKTRAWWESLSLMEKVNIIDYKFTLYNRDWDSLNKIDHEIIKKHYLKELS